MAGREQAGCSDLAGIGRVDVEGPRHIGGRAVEFLVDPVAQAANGLRQQHVGGDEVEPHENVELLDHGIDDDGQDAADETAIDAQTAEAAAPEIDDLDGILDVVGKADAVGRRAEDVIKARTDDADHQRPGQHVPDVVGVVARLGGCAAGQPCGEHGTADDEDAVPVQREWTKLEDYRIHADTLLRVDGDGWLSRVRQVAPHPSWVV